MKTFRTSFICSGTQRSSSFKSLQGIVHVEFHSYWETVDILSEIHQTNNSHQGLLFLHTQNTLHFLEHFYSTHRYRLDRQTLNPELILIRKWKLIGIPYGGNSSEDCIGVLIIHSQNR